MRKNLKMLKLILGMVFVINIFSQTLAQSYSVWTFTAIQTEEGVAIYNINESGNISFVTTFQDFALGEAINPTLWFIPNPEYMTNSSSGEYITFSAIQGADYALFIYKLSDNSFVQIPLTDLAIPYWSPDSTSIILVLNDLRKGTYVYNLEDNSLIRTGGGANISWLPDSSGLIFIGGGSSCQEDCPYTTSDLYVTDRFGDNKRALTDLASEIGLINPITICSPTWSNVNRRIYYMVGCSGGGDVFHKYIYSVDLNGNNRLEMDLDNLFLGEEYVKIMGIYPEIQNNGVYIAMRSQNGILRFMLLNSPNDIEIIYAENLHGQYLSHSLNSVSMRFMAFSNESYQKNGYLKIFNIYDIDLIREIMFDQANVCELNWLNDTVLLYSVLSNIRCLNATPDSAYTYEIYNTETNVITQLPQNISDIIWIIRPTYISSPIPLIITESDGSTIVTESGATDTYTLVLGTQPTADVTVSITGDTQVSVSPSVITFTPENWDVPQTVTASAVDDSVVEGDYTAVITHSAVSADAGYNGISVADVTVNIGDDIPSP